MAEWTPATFCHRLVEYIHTHTEEGEGDACVHTHAGMHARMHAHMHEHTHAHTHTHIHTPVEGIKRPAVWVPSIWFLQSPPTIGTRGLKPTAVQSV